VVDLARTGSSLTSPHCYHSDVFSLVRSRPPDDCDLRDLRDRVSEQTALLDAQLARLTQLESELETFKARYCREVGRRHDELDELDHEIAELELAELTRQLGAEPTGRPSVTATERREAAPRFTTDAVRKLFRDVAKAVHPDLADSEHARQRRHALMIEANRAYALGDERRLRAILLGWETSIGARSVSDSEAVRLELLRRLARIHDQLEACKTDLAALEDSALWKLKLMSDDAAARGRDLIEEMVRALTRDIMAARNRRDAIRAYG
jgi:hypothetical protein